MDIVDAVKQRPNRKSLGLVSSYLKTGVGFPMSVEWEAQLMQALKRSENSLCWVSDGIEKKQIKDFNFDDGEKRIAEKACMIFEHGLTSDKQDRDGDILLPKGASIDPMMPLLWQHMPMMPIGRYLKVTERNDNFIKCVTGIANNEAGNDAAYLVEFGALRISHGFTPLSYRQLSRDESSKDTPWQGFLIERYEVMEVSLVSVPSNTDAVITAFSREKLKNPFIKNWAGQINMSKPIVVPTTTKDTSNEGMKFLESIKSVLKKSKEEENPKDEEKTELEQLRSNLQSALDAGKDELNDEAKETLRQAIQQCSEMIGAERASAKVSKTEEEKPKTEEEEEKKKKEDEAKPPQDDDEKPKTEDEEEKKKSENEEEEDEDEEDEKNFAILSKRHGIVYLKSDFDEDAKIALASGEEKAKLSKQLHTSMIEVASSLQSGKTVSLEVLTHFAEIVIDAQKRCLREQNI